MTTSREDLLRRAAANRRESKYLDFKEGFDPGSIGEWCELIKDVIAMANSGGGVILFGVKNNGKAHRTNLQRIFAIDHATIVDKVFSFTGEQFADVEIEEVRRGRRRLPAMLIDGVPIPLVFTQPGSYERDGKRKTAFAKGTLYVRHGAKSEPATRTDIGDLIARRLEEVQRQWLGGIRQVVEAPADAEVAMLKATQTDEAGRPTRFRLTTEPGAPVYGMVDPDESHPYRQTEVIEQVNGRLPRGRKPVNTYDIQTVRTVHQIDEAHAPEFAHEMLYGSTQYSDAFVDWLITEYRSDKDFFQKARDRYQLTHR